MTGYKGGRIVRIKVNDFMTYDDLELFPKKGLNIIIGLNGSGKSSLMSAICLGLAGKPLFTGKSTQLADFIKHGKQKATIEIELEDPVENVVFRRIIEGDKSTYFLNDSCVQRNEVVATLERYNIDVGNLCQFLPQEKVSDFSKINQTQRLEIMMKAIGEPVLHTLFSDLKQMKVDSIHHEKELQELKNTKTSQIQSVERLKVEVDKHEERVRLQEELETFQLQKKSMQYKVYQHGLKHMKKEIKKLESEKVKIENDLNKMESELHTVSSSSNEILGKIKKTRKKFISNSDQLSKFLNKLAELYAEIQSAKIEYRNRIEEKQSQEEKLVDLERQIQALRRLDDNHAVRKREVQQSAIQNSSQCEKVKEEIAALDSKLENIKLMINNHKYKSSSLQGDLSQLKNENTQMKNLKDKCGHTYQAVCWLEKNQSSFKSTIFYPPLLSVRVDKAENCKYIENVIGIKDLKTFICTDEDDLTRLVNILRVQMKLNVNIGLAPQQDISCFSTPAISPILRQLGVKGFVSELFTAPDAVMCYLCALSKLHEMPVCEANANNNIEELLGAFKKFYTPDERISGVESRYGSRNLTIRRDSVVDKHLILRTTNSSSRMQELEAGIKEAQQQIEKLISQADLYEKQRSEFEKDQEKLRQERNELSENYRRIASLEEQLRQKIELHDRKKSAVINEKDEKKKLTLRMCSLNKSRMKIVPAMNNLGLDLVSLKLQNTKDIMYAKVLSQKIASLRKEIEEKKSHFHILEKNLNEKILESNEKREKALELLNYIKNHKSFSGLKELLCHMPLLEEVEDSIIRIQAQLDLNYENNESILQQYREQQKSMLHTTKKIEHSENMLKHLRIQMEEKKKQWLPALESHIKIVNKKFSQCYKLLKCAGEISLETGDDPNDFAQYGLQVRLKYRDNEPFSVLSSDHHSGGERNVASIIFILSLQELSTVPFRCVDEINQGMDSSNERKMYEFIANEATTNSCSQYFLLTPKLLKNLSYHKDVAVHVIFNSKYLHTKFNVQEHLKIAAKN